MQPSWCSRSGFCESRCRRIIRGSRHRRGVRWFGSGYGRGSGGEPERGLDLSDGPTALRDRIETMARQLEKRRGDTRRNREFVSRFGMMIGDPSGKALDDGSAERPHVRGGGYGCLRGAEHTARITGIGRFADADDRVARELYLIANRENVGR